MHEHPVAIPLHDPDMTHLLQLLAVLPGPDDEGFWQAYTTRQDGTPDPNTYLMDKISSHCRAILREGEKVSRQAAASLASYCILFFSDPGPERTKVLDDAIRCATPGHGVARMWCQDITATAWKIWVDSTGSPEEVEARMKAWAARLPR